MTQRRLKKYVIPTIYVLSVTAIFLSIILLGKTFSNLFQVSEDYDSNPAMDVVNETPKPDLPVMNTPETEVKIIKPFTVEEVQLTKDYYDKNADETTQTNSLIYYENTYIQNTGILYSHSEAFDVVAVMDGTVTNIKEDDLLGKIVEIKHNTNLITVYQSLSEVTVKVGSSVTQGSQIGTSGSNKIDSANPNCLLFEVYYKGLLLNPNTFYNMKIEDLAE